MTRIEKESVIKAAAYYRDAQARKAKAARKKGEYKRAAEHSAEASTAHSIVSMLCAVLDEPCGTCSI